MSHSVNDVSAEHLKSYLDHLIRLVRPCIYHEKMVLTDAQKEDACSNVAKFFSTLSIKKLHDKKTVSMAEYIKCQDIDGVSFDADKGEFVFERVKLLKDVSCTLSTGHIIRHLDFLSGAKLPDFVIIPQIVSLETTDGSPVKYLQNVIAKERADNGLVCVSFIPFEAADSATVRVTLTSFLVNKLETQRNNAIKAKNKNFGNLVVNFESAVDFSTTKVTGNVVTIDAKDKVSGEAFNITVNLKPFEPLIITGRRREPKYHNYITTPGVVVRMDARVFEFPNKVYGSPTYQYNTNAVAMIHKRTKLSFSEGSTESLLVDNIKLLNGSCFTANDMFMKTGLRQIVGKKARKAPNYATALDSFLARFEEIEPLPEFVPKDYDASKKRSLDDDDVADLMQFAKKAKDSVNGVYGDLHSHQDHIDDENDCATPEPTDQEN